MKEEKTKEMDVAQSSENKAIDKEAAINHNRAYLECKVDVATTMRPDGNGGEKLKWHVGDIGKVIKTVQIEPHRAASLNRTWETRRIIYLLKDDRMPVSIKRTPSEDEEGNPIWKDEPTYEIASK